MKQLYLDLDGVMADFDQHFFDTFGQRSSAVTKKEMWSLIYDTPNFFSTIPPMEGALEAWGSWLHWYEPIVLTSAGSSNYSHVAVQKREWVRKHLGRGVQVVPVADGLHKPLVMRDAGDILIDDWGKNVEAWELAGGKGIKHEHDWGLTHQAFVRAMVGVPYSDYILEQEFGIGRD